MKVAVALPGFWLLLLGLFRVSLRMRLKLSGVVVVKQHVPRTTTTAIKSKGQRRKALAQRHVSSVGSASFSSCCCAFPTVLTNNNKYASLCS